MTPAAIIKQATADGVQLELSPIGTIKATGKQAAVTRWLPLIRQHKPELLEALSGEPPNVPAAAPTTGPAERARLGDAVAPEAELIALVDAVADFHGFNPEQRAEAKQIALADLEAALECFRGLAAKQTGAEFKKRLQPTNGYTKRGNHA
ncbi:MAG: hypothetical protein HY525_09470 [Betaproteobacteria bacterium]|nr:hypothetical protein [Betaproteobacteria bacterium]